MVLNVEREAVFKTNDDILEILRTHPDFARVPPDSLQPLLAALLSGVLVAGGASLLYVTGGAALGPMVLGLCRLRTLLLSIQKILLGDPSGLRLHFISSWVQCTKGCTG